MRVPVILLFAIVLGFSQTSQASRTAILLSGKESCSFARDLSGIKAGLGDSWNVQVFSGAGHKTGLETDAFKKDCPQEAEQALAKSNAATEAQYRKALAAAAKDPSSSELLLYVTDHCNAPETGVPGDAAAEQFNIQLASGNLSMGANRKLLSSYPANKNLILVADCCFSEAQVKALFNKDAKGNLIPIVNRCGFSSSRQDETSKEGYAALFAELASAKDQDVSFNDVYEKAVEASPSFDSPSIPQATSDIYLADLGKNGAATEQMCLAPVLDGATLKDTQKALIQPKAKALDDALARVLSELNQQTLTEKELQNYIDLVNSDVNAKFKAKDQAVRQLNAAITKFKGTLSESRELEANAHELNALDKKLVDTAAAKAPKSELAKLQKDIAKLLKKTKELSAAIDKKVQAASGTFDAEKKAVKSAQEALGKALVDNRHWRQADRLMQQRKGIRALVEQGSAEEQNLKLNGLLNLLKCEQTVIRK